MRNNRQILATLRGLFGDIAFSEELIKKAKLIEYYNTGMVSLEKGEVITYFNDYFLHQLENKKVKISKSLINDL